MEVTELLNELGNPGLYQIILYLCLFLCNSTVAMNHLIMAVYRYTPSYSCKVSKNVILSPENQCEVYTNTSTGTTAACTTGWDFSLQGKETSIVNEWSLVCDDKYLVSAATTIYFAGVMLGGAIFGQLSDKFGRKPILLVCMYGHIVLGTSIYFVSSYEGFIAIRFFLGFLIQGLQTSSYVLLVEMTALKYRPLTAGLFEVFWAVGNLWMTSLAWLIKDWREIQLALCLPSLITLLYLYFVPESLRWLVLQKKHRQAEKISRRIAAFNKVSLSEEINLSADSSPPKHDGKNYSFHDLFRTKQIRKRTLLMGYIWLASSIGYYGLTLNAGGLAGNRFVNLFISASVEVAAFVSVIFVLKFLTRRKPLIIYYLLGGISCIVAGAIPKEGSWVDVAKGFAIFGKLFLSAAFSTIFLFTVELFPTVIRTTGMGSCVFWARVGGMIAPQILLTSAYTFEALPFIIFGVLSLLAALATYFVPETRGLTLPPTIEDVEGEEENRTKTEELS